MVISLLGNEVSLSVIGKYQRETPFHSWAIDTEVEMQVGRNLKATGRNYISSAISADDHEQFKLDPKKAVAFAKKSAADSLIILVPNSTIRKLGSPNGMTHSITLNCGPQDSLPNLLFMYRAEIWNLKSQKQIASSPLVIETHYNGVINCESFASAPDVKVEKSFEPPYLLSVKQLANDSVQGMGFNPIEN